jgi:putative phage-type endonuclease
MHRKEFPMTDREQWLAERRTGLGASDAAAVVGVSPWKSALAVYLDKTGQAGPDIETAPMRWGTKLEPVILAAYEEETGNAIERPGIIMRHPERPWQLCTLDGWIPGQRVIEAKTANQFAADEWGEPGTDEIPDAYMCQVQHQLAVTGLEVADVPVLIGASDFRIYTIQRHQRMIDHLNEMEAEFWARVERRDPPEPDWEHALTPALIESMHKPAEGVAIDLGDDALALADAMAQAKELSRSNDEAAKVHRAKLVALMGEASLARLPDQRTIRRQLVQRKGYEVAATEYLDFRILKAKKEKVSR